MKNKAIFWIAAVLLPLGGPLAAHPVIVNNWSAVRWYLSLPADDGRTVRVEIAPGSKKFEPAKSTFEVAVPEGKVRLPLWDCAGVSRCDIVLTCEASSAPKVEVEHKGGAKTYGVSVDAGGEVQIFSQTFTPPEEAPSKASQAAFESMPLGLEIRERLLVDRIHRDQHKREQRGRERLERAMRERNRGLAFQPEGYETKAPAHAPAPGAKAPEPKDEAPV